MYWRQLESKDLFKFLNYDLLLLINRFSIRQKTILPTRAARTASSKMRPILFVCEGHEPASLNCSESGDESLLKMCELYWWRIYVNILRILLLETNSLTEFLTYGIFMYWLLQKIACFNQEERPWATKSQRSANEILKILMKFCTVFNCSSSISHCLWNIFTKLLLQSVDEP